MSRKASSPSIALLCQTIAAKANSLANTPTWICRQIGVKLHYFRGDVWEIPLRKCSLKNEESYSLFFILFYPRHSSHKQRQRGPRLGICSDDMIPYTPTSKYNEEREPPLQCGLFGETDITNHTGAHRLIINIYMLFGEERVFFIWVHLGILCNLHSVTFQEQDGEYKVLRWN